MLNSRECGLREAKPLVQLDCRSPDITNEGSGGSRIGGGMSTECIPTIFNDFHFLSEYFIFSSDISSDLNANI